MPIFTIEESLSICVCLVGFYLLTEATTTMKDFFPTFMEKLNNDMYVQTQEDPSEKEHNEFLTVDDLSKIDEVDLTDSHFTIIKNDCLKSGLMCYEFNQHDKDSPRSPYIENIIPNEEDKKIYRRTGAIHVGNGLYLTPAQFIEKVEKLEKIKSLF